MLILERVKMKIYVFGLKRSVAHKRHFVVQAESLKDAFQKILRKPKIREFYYHGKTSIKKLTEKNIKFLYELESGEESYLVSNGHVEVIA